MIEQKHTGFPGFGALFSAAFVPTFSFGHAIQQPALDIWSGVDTNVDAAQQALLQRDQLNFAANRRNYSAAMERKTS